MFTGIVEEVGTIRVVEPGRLVVGAAKVTQDLPVGGSVSVNGACLTATTVSPDSFAVDVVPETLRRTNLGALRVGDPVNLERAVRADGRLDGHIVQGHVDGVGTISALDEDAQALMVRVDTPPSLLKYIVEKGFIAVDGTSLTVVHCDSGSFTFTLIPHTRSNTVFGVRRIGDPVNLETDILAKYVERLAAHRK